MSFSLIVFLIKSNFSLANSLGPGFAVGEKRQEKKNTAESQKKSAKNRGRFLDGCGLPCIHHSDHGLGRLLQAHKRTDSGFDRGTKGCLQDSLATYAQIFKFFPESLTVFIQLCSWPEFLEISFERFAFRKFNSFRNFRKRFWEISVPFAAISKFSKVLVEWKAPLFFRTEYSK